MDGIEFPLFIQLDFNLRLILKDQLCVEDQVFLHVLLQSSRTVIKDLAVFVKSLRELDIDLLTRCMLSSF